MVLGLGEKKAEESATANAASGSSSGEKPKLKPCCACPETKKLRDACIVENGQENCQALIEAHLKCMRDLGFNI